MSDIESLWAQATNKRFDDPKEQKEFERSRLDTLTTAAVTQAMWRASSKKVLFMVFGFLIIPTAFFHIAASIVGADNSNMVAIFGLSAYVLGIVLVYLIGTRLIDGNPEDELPQTIKPLLIAEAEFKKKWGSKG